MWAGELLRRALCETNFELDGAVGPIFMSITHYCCQTRLLYVLMTEVPCMQLSSLSTSPDDTAIEPDRLHPVNTVCSLSESQAYCRTHALA